ncbi:MAG: hypothetical protein ACFFCM_12530 [Promethearchaeota archaeon]
MENVKLIGFLLVLAGMFVIILIFIIQLPNQLVTPKMLLIYVITIMNNPTTPYDRGTIANLLILTFALLVQFEVSPLWVYFGVILGIFGAILMYFEGISLEIYEEDEESPKSKAKNKSDLIKN